MTTPTPAKPAQECRCTFAQKTVGDGCEVCNPALSLRYARQTIAELEAELQSLRDELKATKDRMWEVGRENEALRERVEKAEKDAARIDAIATGYWKVDPFDIPTGQGDADVGWRVAEYHQSAPTEREVAVEYGDDLRAAIDAAIAKGAQS